MFSSNSRKIVILRAYDFFDFPRFFPAQPTVVLKLPQGRHPERSASQTYRLTEGLWRAVEGPRGCHLTHAVRSFSTTEPHRVGRHGLSPGRSDLRLQAPALL